MTGIPTLPTPAHTAHPAFAEHATEVIRGVLERVFGAVAAVRDLALDRHAEVTARGDRLRDDDITSLRGPLLDLLGRESEVAVGLGLILAPRVLADQPLRLEWWQAPDGGAPARLEVDLNPASVGFYDYVAAEWFVVPQQRGQRHVVGPYVDVHGTDLYLLTLTMPIVADGEFLGVAGADVPVARFETLVLRELGDAPSVGDLVVVNGEGRVVLSTSARWLIGSLAGPDAGPTPDHPTGIPTDVRTGPPPVQLSDPPWRLVALDVTTHRGPA